MSWQKCICSSKSEFKAVYNAALDYFREGKLVDIKIREHQGTRKDSQNALQFIFFQEMEEQGDQSSEWYRAYFKLTEGVPIARETSEGFRELYDRTIRTLDYETKLRMMGWEFDLPVTRTFTTTEMTRYLNRVIVRANELGFRLSTRGNVYDQAMGSNQ